MSNGNIYEYLDTGRQSQEESSSTFDDSNDLIWICLEIWGTCMQTEQQKIRASNAISNHR